MHVFAAMFFDKADQLIVVPVVSKALDRCIRHENAGSVYDERGLMVF